MFDHVRAGLGVAALCLAATAGAQSADPVVTPTPPVAVTVAKPLEVVSGTMLPSNTEVFLALDKDLTSKKARVGDSLEFHVARDVMLGQYVVIPRGTPATGKITYRTGKGVFGKSAKMEFSIDQLVLAGKPITLSGVHRISGDGNTGATVGAVVAAGVIGGLVVTGRSATAAAGSEWKAMTKEPVAVSITG
ncbi:hypothetical protein [Sphingomonas astaxanthinifaciens]|uniref:Uncharacterized protein n=1 Tax=Sphingomonas astaxanthinifaciens DSM 22298 TaxID=1123267 RepID=A0ABQ5ZCQ8_9SPHN|nr:hypothetical protein [Sphingomonas astaxanthinifaciens]GLR48678.1 hypothetical protein GCM10007925_23970 [Sphingomonas astaxanthinifaciens DSM 22298]